MLGWVGVCIAALRASNWATWVSCIPCRKWALTKLVHETQPSKIRLFPSGGAMSCSTLGERMQRSRNTSIREVYKSKKAIVFEMCDFDYQSNICFHCAFNICSSKILYWGWNIRLNMLNDWTCFSLSISQCWSVYKNKWLIRERKINRDFGEWFPSLGSRALRRTTSSFHPR
jgi:hypothetical protein